MSSSTVTAPQGLNVIAHEPPRSPWAMLGAQVNSPVVWLLLAACCIAALLGEVADAVAIGVIVVINALVGFFQEYRAERALLALREMTAPRARVIRDGRLVVIAAADVVVGDVLVLEAGDIVAADARLVEAHALSTNEAPLTGESVPVEKDAAPSSSATTLADKRDHVFMGTSVVTGTAKAEVVTIGSATELGKIATLIATAEPGPTPLTKRLEHVGRTLLYACVGIVVVVAGLGLWRGADGFTVFLSAVSLAVAAIPEGLPAVVTIALALGVQRMAARHVLIRRLAAVETLGCATVICTDKTGTLTTGVMAVRSLWGRDELRLLDAAVACCDAELGADGDSGVGDPTEVAILVEAARRGLRRDIIERSRPRRAVVPFDVRRKRMSIRRADGLWYIKGAVEVIVPLCNSGADGALDANTRMAAHGLRVIAVAVGQASAEADLELLGLIGIADPPRPEAIAAVAAARRAGIKTVMITGDHPLTAGAIATELGITASGEASGDVVHARATPEDKLTIVREWKGRGAVVAMTGDGVNDAPALREAHIGICMGITGTEVTREASDMVLTDDNFASIIDAVREGRAIFDNIRKALVYLLSGNAGELAVMLVASLVGLPLPLLPLHLLWINLVTDGLPALALVIEPSAGDTMTRPPRRTSEPMLGRREWLTIVATGLLQTTVTLAAFIWALRERDVVEARTLAFSVIVLAELLRALAARSTTKVFWELGAFGNLALLSVITVSSLAQVAIVYVPITRRLFQLTELPAADWQVVVVAALMPVTILELAKLARSCWRRAGGS